MTSDERLTRIEAALMALYVEAEEKCRATMGRTLEETVRVGKDGMGLANGLVRMKNILDGE